MAISFPPSPTVGQIYTLPSGQAWKWNGSAWDSLGSPGVTGPAGPAGPTGPVGPNGPLDILTDVTYPIGGPQDGDVLQYNGGLGQWEPVNGKGIEVFLNFEAAGSFDYIVPYDLVFSSFSTSVAMTTGFLVGTFSYLFGTQLDQYEVLTVTTDTPGLITLIGTRL